jgi:hypothetical protein
MVVAAKEYQSILKTVLCEQWVINNKAKLIIFTGCAFQIVKNILSTSWNMFKEGHSLFCNQNQVLKVPFSILKQSCI